MKTFQQFKEQLQRGQVQPNPPQTAAQYRSQSIRRASQINRQMRLKAHDELHAHQSNVRAIEGERPKKT